MSEGKFIGNVNFLDLRKTTDDSIANIRGVGNVNVVLYTSETAHLLTKLAIGNMNSSVEVPSDVEVEPLMGQTIIKKERFDHLEAPIFSVFFGQVIFDPEVTADMVLNGFHGIVAVGQMVVPEALEGALQSRTRLTIGQVQTYPILKQTRYGTVELSERWLQSLEDNTEICVLGKLAAPNVVSTELLEQKLKRLYVLEKISCHEENAGSLQNCLVEGSGAVTVIPAGFVVVEKPLRLDMGLLEALPARKLLCKEVVQIDPEVPAQLLDERLDEVRSEEMILCPNGLRGVLSKKCDLLKNQVVFYEGLLWLVKDENSLHASFFDSVEGKVTLVVTGELILDASIDAKILATRLAKVHNLGVIRCTPEQMGVVQARLGLQDGTLEDSTQKVEPEKKEDSDFIGNANYLAL